jgi:uncharacterized SAM-binding protein YcdF (DUF218 family)
VTVVDDRFVRTRSRVRARRRVRGRRVLFAGLVLGALVVAYFLVTLVQVWRTARTDRARPAEAIVVLGAAQYDGRPSPVLEARLTHAAALYQRGLAPVIVVTGGRADGDRFSEAAASANFLHGLGVPDDVILREDTGRNTWESLVATARFLHERGMSRVVLVSDGYHLARAKGIAGDVGLDASTSPTPGGPPVGRLVKETVAVGVGRIIGFGRMSRLVD